MKTIIKITIYVQFIEKENAVISIKVSPKNYLLFIDDRTGE